jgi:CBS domain-containing protein
MQPVTLAIREAPNPLASTMKVSEAIHYVDGSSLSSLPVSDDDGLVGMVRVNDIRDAVPNHGEWTLAELMRERSHGDDHFAHVHTDHPLSQALSRMGETDHEVLPVVSRANARIVLGVVTLKDVLRAYGVEKSKRTSEFKNSLG